MESAIAKPEPSDEPRMGSEYSTARRYLSQSPRASVLPARKKPVKQPQHGSNDSDFGIPDQDAE